MQRWVFPLCSQAPHGRAHLCLSAHSKVPCEGTLIGDTPAHGTGSWAMAAPCDDSRQPQLLGPGEFLLWSYFCIASKFTRETLHLSGAAPSCLLQSATGETAHPAWGGPGGQAGIPWGTAAFPQLRPSRGKGKQPCCTPSSSWAAPTLKQPYPVFCFFFFPRHKKHQAALILPKVAKKPCQHSAQPGRRESPAPCPKSYPPPPVGMVGMGTL